MSIEALEELASRCIKTEYLDIADLTLQWLWELWVIFVFALDSTGCSHASFTTKALEATCV